MSDELKTFNLRGVSENILEEVKKLTGEKTNNKAVLRGLEEYIQAVKKIKELESDNSKLRYDLQERNVVISDFKSSFAALIEFE